MSVPPAPNGGPGPAHGAGPAEPPEQLLRRESERIVEMLRVRRQATMVIAVVFVLATASAFVLLAWYVRGEQRRIDDLSARLESAGQRMQEQEAWLGRLEENRALVDSILTQYQALLSAARDSTMRYADSLVAARDGELRADVREEVRAAETRVERQAALADSLWSRHQQEVADSLGLRMTRAEGLAGSLVGRLDTIAPRIARHDRRLRKADALADSVRGALADLGRDIEREAGAIERIQLDISALRESITQTNGRLDRLQGPRTAQPPSP